MGVGFSYTQSELGYVTSEEQVGENFVTFLTQFFTIFSEYKTNKFFVVCIILSIILYLLCLTGFCR